MADSDSLYQAAMAALRAGDSASAADSLTTLTAQEPDRADAWLYLGVAQAMSNRDAEAEASLQRAIELAPGEARAHYNLARLLQRRGDQAGAIASYQRALEADPGNSKAREAMDALTAPAAAPSAVYEPPAPPWASSPRPDPSAVYEQAGAREQPTVQTVEMRGIAVGSAVLCAMIVMAVTSVPNGILNALGKIGELGASPARFISGLVGAVVLGPVLAAIFSAPAAALHAVFYNFVAGRAGGVVARVRWRGERCSVQYIDPISAGKVAALVYLCWVPLLLLLVGGLFAVAGALIGSLAGFGHDSSSSQAGAGMLVGGLIACAGVAVFGPVCVWIGAALKYVVYNLVASATGGIALPLLSAGRDSYQAGSPEFGPTALTLFLTNLPFLVVGGLFFALALAAQHLAPTPQARTGTAEAITTMITLGIAPVVQTLAYMLAAGTTGGLVVDLESA